MPTSVRPSQWFLVAMTAFCCCFRVQATRVLSQDSKGLAYSSQAHFHDNRQGRSDIFYTQNRRNLSADGPNAHALQGPTLGTYVLASASARRDMRQCGQDDKQRIANLKHNLLSHQVNYYDIKTFERLKARLAEFGSIVDLSTSQLPYPRNKQIEDNAEVWLIDAGKCAVLAATKDEDFMYSNYGTGRYDPWPPLRAKYLFELARSWRARDNCGDPDNKDTNNATDMAPKFLEQKMSGGLARDTITEQKTSDGEADVWGTGADDEWGEDDEWVGEDGNDAGWGELGEHGIDLDVNEPLNKPLEEPWTEQKFRQQKVWTTPETDAFLKENGFKKNPCDEGKTPEKPEANVVLQWLYEENVGNEKITEVLVNCGFEAVVGVVANEATAGQATSLFSKACHLDIGSLKSFAKIP